MATTASTIRGQVSGTQLTRTLERVLEDAQVTGELRLSGRKLKDFPKISKYNLTDTVIADLSKNRFSEIPVEVCEFTCMEQMDCYNNVIRTIPDAVIRLQSLTHLNLCRNHLAILPEALCKLASLQVLLLSNNKLVSLPEEIGRLAKLMELDVSCNEISYLPPQIEQLDNLRSLNIRRNLLVELPIEISKLKLTKLDISGNRISTLPVELRKIHCLIDLVLHNNPLISPPSYLCTRGRVHVFKFLEIQAIKDDKRKGILDSELQVGRNRFDAKLHNLPLDKRKRCTIDSGYNTSEGSDYKRWSQELQDRETSNQRADYEERLKMEEWKKSDGQESYDEDAWSNSRKNFDPEKDSISRTMSNRSSSTSIFSGLSSSEIEGNPFGSTDIDAPAENNPKTFPHTQTYREYIEAKRHRRAVENTNLYRRPMTEGETSPPIHNAAVNEAGQYNHSRTSETGLTNHVSSSRSSPSHSSSHSDHPINGVLSSSILSLSSNSARSTGSNHSSKNAEYFNSSFTIRREFQKAKEEAELISQLRQAIETRLKVSLPEDISSSLMDGVVLCHLANHVRPRSVASIHVPSPAVPKLTMAKCRKNVENFLEACRIIGIDEADLCSYEDIILKQHPERVMKTLQHLLAATRPCISEPLLSFLCLFLFLGTCVMLYFLPPPTD